MGVGDQAEHERLCAAVDELLKTLDIPTVIGPPMAYFMVPGAERFEYMSFVYKGATEEEMTQAALSDLSFSRLMRGYPLVWRKRPMVSHEHGFWKGHMRFVHVPSQEIADKAAAMANDPEYTSPRVV